jgi:filamentous hemagglutinin family protein
VTNANYGLSLGAYFGAALNTSESVSTNLVPSVFPIAIDGKPYNLDFNNPMGGNLYRRDSVALLRTQADSARVAGESSVSPEIFWRRSFDSWYAGAGQTHADRETSNPYRFRASKGMDVWTKGELKALGDVAAQNPATPNENIGLVVAGSRLYSFNATKTYFTTETDASWAWTEVTGTPASAPVGIASDGKNIWIAHPAGIYSTTTSSSAVGGSAFATPPAGNWTGIWFNKGKLFASTDDGKMHTISGAGTVTSVIDRSTLGFTWTSATGVGGYHYFAGYSGDKSIIFKVTLTAEGTALSAGIVAGELPDSEKVLHLDGYLGYLIIGTNKGVRFANTDTNGYITIGGLIQTNQPVYCSEGQDRFVWFGWGYYDSVSSGLGRMDLSEFTATLTPAYASDLMAGKPALKTSLSIANQIAADPILGDVVSVVTYDNKRVFAVKAKGIFTETTAKVPLATLDTGLISHGIIDTKYAAFMDARMEPLASNNVLRLSHSVDSGNFVLSGSSGISGSIYSGDFFVGDQGRNFEIRITFGDISPSVLVGANVTCTGFMLRSYPSPKRVSKFSVPVMLFDSINVADRDWSGNPGADFEFLLDLHRQQLPFSYQEGEISYTVVMDDFQWLPEKRSNVSGFQGTFVAVLREIL